MQATPNETPIIKTTALKRLETLVEQVANTAELAIVKGPAGIGKTYAIDYIKEKFNTQNGLEVFTVTARTEIAGKINAIACEIVHPLGGRSYRAAECMVVQTNWKALSTLRQLIETKGARPEDISKTLDMLMEPNSVAREQIEAVRVLMGRSALVCRQSPDDQSGRRTLQ